jgi:hypothetical protein
VEKAGVVSEVGVAEVDRAELKGIGASIGTLLKCVDEDEGEGRIGLMFVVASRLETVEFACAAGRPIPPEVGSAGLSTLEDIVCGEDVVLEGAVDEDVDTSVE